MTTKRERAVEFPESSAMTMLTCCAILVDAGISEKDAVRCVRAAYKILNKKRALATERKRAGRRKPL